MKTNEIIKAIMKQRGLTLATMANKMGYKTASGVAERLKGNMRVDVLTAFAEALDCDIIIKSRLTDKTVYTITKE